MIDTIQEIQEDLERFKEEFEELRIQTLLTGEYDKCSAIVTIHAGAGGTESCDWASMLYRMYTRWAEKKGYSVEVLDYLEGDVAGIKGVTFEVQWRKCIWISAALKRVCIVLCVFHHLMQQENDRLRLHPAM